jgi:SAM-dependent methyltransferase
MIADAARCLRTYSRSKVVSYYTTYLDLEKPEATLLRALGSRLGSMRMLDIGVGGGRITEHFAPRVREYHGIDLCPTMVEACRRRFLGRIPQERFEVRDMRNLETYAAHSFDFILITFNTIDHLSHRERASFVAQVRRILAPGGYFYFSSHNIRSLASYLTPARWWSGLRAWRHRARFLKLNRALLAAHDSADYLVLNNGAHDDFGLQLYYVRPEAQIAALQRAGFDQVSVYSLDSGEELSGAQIGAAADRWLYYLCR